MPVLNRLATVGLACALVSPASAQLLTQKSLSAATSMTIAQTALGAVQHLTGIIAAQGALPIKAGDEVIGAVGVSGAPGGEKDEACAKAGIDKVADQLK
jgi:uncharacterized protein GlcG (DUF336 family)